MSADDARGPGRGTGLVAIVLAAVAVATPAHAEDAATTPEVTPASTATTPATDAAVFCTRPTGRWWEDYAATGCVDRVAGRTAAAPLTPTELSWLDLGDLPAHADVDVDALGAELARFEARVLAEAAAGAAAEAARATTAASQPRPDRGTAPRARRGGTTQWLLTPGQVEEISASCGFTPGTVAAAARGGAGTSDVPSSAPASDFDDAQMSLETRIDEECRTVTPRPSDDLMPGSTEWDGYFRALAVCVDQRLPGHLARWEQEQAEQRARYEEARIRERAAWDRLRERQERARQEIRDRCPHGGWATPTKHMASSPDEVDYVVHCHAGP